MEAPTQEIGLPTGKALTKAPGSAKTLFKLSRIRADIVPGAESDVPEMDATTRAGGDKPQLAAVMPRLRPAVEQPQLLKREVPVAAAPARQEPVARVRVPGQVRYHPEVRRNSVLSRTVPNAAGRKAIENRQTPAAPAASTPANDNVIIQLGRYGDIMNVLPALLLSGGGRKTLMASRQFADILDGVSYVDRKIFEGPAEQVGAARRRAPGALVAQLWGDSDAPPRGENYQRDSWKRIGKDHRWEQIGLWFDKRDAKRERELADRVLGGTIRPYTPVVLVNISGHSSPFSKGPQLLADLRYELAGQLDVVDISNVKAHRIFDLLGLYDRANMLVSIDSAPLHLAQASSIPVCALVNDSRWHASLRRTNHAVYRPYRDVNVAEIADACRRTVPASVSRIIHVYAEYTMNPEDRRRSDLAKRSWGREGVIDRPVSYESDPEVRTADRELGDSRQVPYILDILQRGIELGERDEDIVLLTNSDVGFVSGFAEELRRKCATFGACFGYRADFPRLGEEALGFGKVETMSGGWYGGLDVMAFTIGWLKRFGDKLPDCILGSRDWDIVYRDIMRYFRCGELVASHWHETHNSDWIRVGDATPANAHNTAILKAWRAEHDATRPFSL